MEDKKEFIRLDNCRRNKECYQRNREAKLARRRELYALNNGKEKSYEYYQSKKEDEKYKERRAKAALKYYYKQNGLSWPPNQKELDERRKQAAMKRGKSMLEYHKNHKKEVFKAKKETIECEEIPDLSIAYGDTPQLFYVGPKLLATPQIPGFNPFSD